MSVTIEELKHIVTVNPVTQAVTISESRPEVNVYPGVYIFDHGQIPGLSDDDHPHYYNAARHTKALHDLLLINADTLDTKHYSDISLEIDTDIATHAAAADPHTPYVLASGARALSGNWDIGAGRMIQAEKIQARSSLGLSLFEDGGAGIFIKDGGNVGNTVQPLAKLHIVGPDATPSSLAEFDTASIGQFQARSATITDSLYVSGGAGNSLVLQATDGSLNSTTARNIKMNPFGGNVGILKSPGYPLDIDGDLNLDSGHVIRVNAVQVVSARVIDARIGGSIEAEFAAAYPIAAALLDALRDSQVAHGLAAAA